MTKIKKLLGEKISKLRKERGYTQIEFAEAIDISTTGLSVIETGRGFLTSETLEKILKTLDLSPDELFSFGGIMSDEELYNDVLRQLSVIKHSRDKLIALHKYVKTIL